MEQTDFWKVMSTCSSKQLISERSLIARPLKLAASLEFNLKM